MAVVAKFKVTRITALMGTNAVGTQVPKMSISLQAVYAPNPEDRNYKFWTATPNGEIELGNINEEIAKEFELGKIYNVSFSAE